MESRIGLAEIIATTNNTEEKKNDTNFALNKRRGRGNF
jgi:hypothetical protein